MHRLKAVKRIDKHSKLNLPLTGLMLCLVVVIPMVTAAKAHNIISCKRHPQGLTKLPRTTAELDRELVANSVVHLFTATPTQSNWVYCVILYSWDYDNDCN